MVPGRDVGVSISNRMIILLVAMIVAVAGVGTVNVLYMQRVYHLTNYANTNTVPSLRTLNSTLMQFMKLRIRSYRRLSYPAPTDIPAIESSILAAQVDLQITLEAYDRLISDNTDRELMREDRRLIGEVLEWNEAALTLARQERYAEALSEALNMVPLAIKAQTAVERHIHYNAELGRASSEQALSDIGWAIRFTIGLSVASIAAMSILMYRLGSAVKSRQMAAIVSSSNDAIISKTLSGIITSWNSGASHIFGYTEKEVIGKSITMLIPPDRLHEEGEILSRIRRGEQVDHFETIRLRKDGRPIHISATISPILDSAGRVAGASKIARDITRAKQAEDAMLAAKHEAELANQAKSGFLANMSHEIRTPMNAIIGLTQLVVDSGLPPTQDNQLRKAVASARALLALLNDILDYSKYESGQVQMESIPMRAADIVQQSLDLFAARISEKSLAVTVDIAPDVPDTVLGDPLRLSQVLNNLLGNAIKFTERGGVHIGISQVAHAETARPGTILRFCVNDTGIGLSTEQSTRLFKAFVQADSSVTRRYGGTGLGLAICEKLVTQMGGAISVSSQPGHGAAFAFTIQVEEAACQLPTLTVPPPSPSSCRFDGTRALLAEDQPINQEIATTMLDRMGVTVTLANDGAEAVEKARTQAFDIIFLDLHMPVLDGLETARQLRDMLGPDCPPLVAMSAAVFPEDRHRSAQAGMADFIAKPVEIAELEACLRRMLTQDAPPSASLPPDISPQPAAGFDLDRLSRRLGGDRHLAIRLMRNCVSTYDGFANQLSGLIRQGLYSEAAQAVHTVRGVFGNLGISHIHASSLALENTLKQGHPPDAAALSQFIADVSAILSALALPVQAPDDPVGDPVEEISHILKKIRPFLENGEIIPDDLLAALLRYRHDHPTDSQLVALTECIDRFDHAGALTVLSRMCA